MDQGPDHSEAADKRRDEKDVKRQFREHLIFVEPEVWDAVRQRREAVRNKYKGQRTHAAPGQRTSHAFSGLLVCGVCGAWMVDGGGSRSRYYRCSAAVNGGACTNRRPLREDVLTASAVAELKRVLTDTGMYNQLRERISERLKTFSTRAHDDRKRLQGQAEHVAAEIDRLVTFVRTTDPTKMPGAHEAVRVSLEKATQEHRQITLRLEALDQAPEERVPTVDEILPLVLDVEARVADDPVGARELLRELLLDGKVAMHPQEDGTYRGSSVVFPMNLRWKTRKPRSASAAEAFDLVEGGGCAGRI